VGQYALARFTNTNFVEKTGATKLSDSEGITCVVCHDPHGSPFPKQLRMAVDAKSNEDNLCAQCHNRRATPDWASSRRPLEPHAAHGPLVFGSAGWWPPGLTFDTAASTHGSNVNTRLCATCHVQHYNVNDKATGQFQVTVVGHSFDPIPCVDSNGRPTGAATCSVTQQSFRGCTGSGCHATEATARSSWVAGESDIQTLAALLKTMIDQVPAAEFAANKVNAGKGAEFNYSMALQAGAAAHNPFLVKALLRYSGVALNQTYGIPLPPGLAPTAADARRVRFSSH
jgi:predicted CXXCH cytochrome family protein